MPTTTGVGGGQLMLALAGAVLVAVTFEVNARIGALVLFLVVFALFSQATRTGSLKTKG